MVKYSCDSGEIFFEAKGDAFEVNSYKKRNSYGILVAKDVRLKIDVMQKNFARWQDLLVIGCILNGRHHFFFKPVLEEVRK